MRKIYTAILVLFALYSIAQGFRTKQYFQASQDNATKAVYETTPGNYIAGGLIHDSLNGHYSNRLCLIGLNNTGQVQWTKKYGDYQFEYLNNIFISRWFYKQGNYLYFVGGVKDVNNRHIGTLIKFDFNGNIVWQRIYNDPIDDFSPQRVNSSVDGGFLITGFFENYSSNPYQACLLLKTDANGNELWRKKIHKNIPDVQDGKAIVQDSFSKKIVIAGYQYIGNSSSFAGFNHLLVLDSVGTVMARYNYGSRQGAFYDLIQTKDSNFIVVGCISQNFQVGGYNALKNYAVKFNLNAPAAPIWTAEDGIASTSTYYSCITETRTGDLLLGGILDTMEQHNLPFNCLIRHTKISKTGVVLSNRFYDYKTNGPTDDNSTDMHCLVPTSDGGLITAIEYANTPAPNPFFIVKYDSTGCDSTLAYCADLNAVGIAKIKTAIGQLSIYPNPAKDVVAIDLEDNANGQALNVSFIDLYGREVKRAALEKMNNMVIVKNLSSGLYVLKFMNNDGKVLYQSKFIKEE